MSAADDMAAAFRAHTEGRSEFTRRMAITIGDHFGMTPIQVVRHYENAGLLKRGSADWFTANGGFTRGHVAEVRADNAAARAAR